MANHTKPTAIRDVVEVPVVEVTVMEDRAHVTRRATLELTEGLRRVVVRDVAPVISDKTLLVTIAGDGARLVDARVGRERVVRTDDDDELAKARDTFELERERDALDERIAAAEAAHALLARHVAAVDKVAIHTVADLATDTAWGKVVGAEWSARFDAVRDEQRSLRRELVESEIAMEDLRDERARLQVRIETSRTPLLRANAWIAIDLDVRESGAHEVSIIYIVPGACWRPYHTAQLAADAVQLRTDACVWQNTGEDWRGVALQLSTERPSLGVEPPELASDVITARKKSDTIVVAARDQTIETAGLGGDAIERPPEVPGIDDGGEVQRLLAPGASDIPSDGRPYRIEIGSFSADAEVELVCMAELCDSVLCKTTQINQGTSPILAGPVDLIRDSGYVGRTSVLFIAPGERFELGWGPEPALRITREVEVHRDKTRLLSSWITRTHDVIVHVSNISVEPRTLRVTERVPVSEIEKLEISADQKNTRDGARPDENGFVSWTVTVPAHGTDRVELRYRVKKHEDVQGY